MMSMPGKSPSSKSRKEDDQRLLEIPSARERPPASRSSARKTINLVCRVERNHPIQIPLHISKKKNGLPDNTTSVKVLVLSPNGNVTIRTPNDKATTCLIKNLALKRWKAAATAFNVHGTIHEDLLTALNRAVNKEFKNYCKSDTILKGRDVDELAAFSNKHVVNETEVNLPLWMLAFAVHVELIWKMVKTQQIPLP